MFAFLGSASGYFQARKAVENPLLKETWSLPSWTPYRTGPEKAKLAAMDIWDGQKSRAAAVKPVVQSTKVWRLVGTVRSGKNYAAVVLLEAEGRVQRVVGGDVLPNGEKVIGVRQGSLQIDSDGKMQEIKLFQSIDQQKKK
ncbi:MAG: hypothetical protein K2P94_11500 [Rhodospirillaceae bacterium]|nr:hypothetical protein [Rhodospirillaceae bacterium]